MGAELITAETSMPHGIDGKLIDLNPDNLRSEIDALVSPEAVERVNAFCGESGRFEDPECSIFDKTKYQKACIESKSYGESLDREDIVTMLVAAYRRTQEPDVVVDPCLHTAMVGGMTWGEPEGYDEICLLAESGIFDRPIYSPETIKIPEHLSDVVRQYAASLPAWDTARPGLDLLAETISGALDHSLSHKQVESVFRALVLREKV